MTAAAGFRCSEAAEDRGDPRHASAVPATTWLLVEAPGPWGRDALTSSRIDPAVAARLQARASAEGVRVQLVRRHGRHVARGSGQRWGLADTRPGSASLRWGRFHADEELLTLPFDGSAGVRSNAPAYLVCAHGRHDTCCAQRGRTVARELAQLRPETTWETSHVGGCRFAPNVVVLPEGLYYGGVDAASAAAVVEAYAGGYVIPSLLRGRAGRPLAVQAAEHFARQHLAEAAIDAFALVRAEQCDDGTVSVVLGHRSGPVAVRVRQEAAGPPALLTCASPRASSPGTWALVELTRD